MDEKVIRDFVMEKIGDRGMFLVDINLKPGNIIHLYIDKPEGISIEECVELSREFNDAFDRENEDYELQVSSPGLDMPLRVKEQFEKYRDREVSVKTLSGDKFTGVLKDFSDDEVKLLVEKKVRPEGKKKKKLVTEEMIFNKEDLKAVKAVVSFK